MAAGSREAIFPSRRTNWPTLRSPGETRRPARTTSASSVRAALTRSEPLAIDSCKGQLSITETMVPRIAVSSIFFTNVREARFLIPNRNVRNRKFAESHLGGFPGAARSQRTHAPLFTTRPSRRILLKTGCAIRAALSGTTFIGMNAALTARETRSRTVAHAPPKSLHHQPSANDAARRWQTVRLMSRGYLDGGSMQWTVIATLLNPMVNLPLRFYGFPAHHSEGYAFLQASMLL